MKNKFLLLALSLCALQVSAQESWKKMASLPGAGRNHAIAFSHGTKGYVMTGEDVSLMKDVWEYDSQTNTWKQLANYPGAARSYGIGAVVGDKAYIGMGHSSSAALTDWWEFDFTTSTWTAKATFPGPGRDHPGFAAMNGKIYVGFGDRGSNQYKDWWEYDPAADSWKQKTSYPGLKMHHPNSAQYNNLIYITEGHIKDGTQNHGSVDSYSYNQLTDTWKKLADMPGPGLVAGASFYIGNNKIYSGIGITEPEDAFHKEFYSYDIATNTWSNSVNYPGSGVFGTVNFVIGNAGYVVTGQNSGGSSLQDMYKFTFGPTGTEETDAAGDDFKVYPNPAKNEFMITTTNQHLHFSYSLFNLIGAELRSGTLVESGKINVSDLPDGVYLLKVTDDERTFTKKVIVQ
jgi:N-acetylneuraminic acid mutarotase